MRITNEIKSGIVILIAIGVGVWFFGRTASFKKATYELTTSFQYAGNLKPDALIKLTGIEVGRVKDIKFVYSPETKVECILELDQDAKVRKDSIAYIDTTGFVGDAYVGITAGTAEEFLKNKDAIKSEEPMQARLMMKQFNDITIGLNKILKELDTLLTTNTGNLDEIISNVKVITENFEALSKDIKEHPWKIMFKGKTD